MENYKNNLYFSNFLKEFKQIFDLSEKFIYKSHINNKPHIFIDSLGRFKIYNSLSFILSNENITPQHLLLKYTLKHFNTYFNLSPDFSNYYFYLFGLMIQKIQILPQKQAFIDEFKTNYYSFMTEVYNQLQTNSLTLDSVESIKKIIGSIIFKVSNNNLARSIETLILNYLDTSLIKDPIKIINDYFRFNLFHIFKSSDSDIKLSMKEGLFIKIKQPDLKCIELSNMFKQSENYISVYSYSLEEENDDCNYTVNYCIDSSDQAIKNNIFYYKIVDNFIKRLHQEKIKLIIFNDEVSLHFKQKLIQSGIAFFEVLNFDNFKLILQEMKISTINIFTPSNDLKDFKFGISGQIENITYNDFSNSTHNFINFHLASNVKVSSLNNVVIESFHEEQARIAEIYIIRIFKIVKGCFLYENKFFLIKSQVLDYLFSKLEESLTFANPELIKFFKDIYLEIKIKSHKFFSEKCESLGKILLFLESVLFLFKNLITLDTIIEKKQNSVMFLN